MAEPGDQREAEAQGNSGGNINREAATRVITDIVDVRLQASMEAIVSNVSRAVQQQLAGHPQPRQQGDAPGEPQHR